jgi:N6-L-threonylcarbamoyladenine synthase
LCGVNTAKILGQIFNKPVIPINHILAHLFSPFISYPLEKLKFPALGLVVSGGHTLLILATKKNNKIKFKIIGETRDDAAGEAFDKIARLIGLGYPGGPEIQKASVKVKKSKFTFTPPMLKSQNFDFSYSGLKTEILRTVKKIKKISPLIQKELAFSAQKAIITPLVEKTFKAIKKFKPKIFLLGGGVAANTLLREELMKKISNLIGQKNILFPELKYTIDNAPMVALCAYILLQNKSYNWYSVKVMPENLI